MSTLDWIPANEMNRPTARPKFVAKVDEEVSKLVGTRVMANDPRLVKKLVEIKRGRGFSSEDKPDNFLKDPEVIKELKKTFNPNAH